MTQGANVPAREAVSRILRETARLGLQPRPGTLRGRAARLYKRIYGSLVVCLKIKKLHRRRIALDTAITLCAGHAATRHQEPDPTDRCLTVSTSGSRARRLRLARPRCGVRMCADSGRSPLTFQGHFRMTNILKKWKTGFANIGGQGRAIRPRGHSEPPRFPIDDSLIPRLKVKEPHRRGIAPDTATTLCAEHAAARHQEPDATDRCLTVSTSGSRARRLRLARPRCGVRMCADLGRSPLNFQGRFRMTNILRTWETGHPDIRGQGRAIQQRGHSARPRFRLDGSLIPRLKVKELHRRGIAPDTATTLCVGHAAAPHQEPDPTDRCLTVSTSGSRAPFTSRAPALRCADVCGFGTVPAHLPRALPYDQHTQNMGNRVP